MTSIIIKNSLSKLRLKSMLLALKLEKLNYSKLLAFEIFFETLIFKFRQFLVSYINIINNFIIFNFN